VSTTELLEIRGLAREFASAELRPHTERWDAECAVDAGVFGSIAELGFFGMLVPESDGGMGFGAETYAAALEEIAWGEAGVALVLAQSVAAADLIARFGDADVRERLLGPLAAGERFACLAAADDGITVDDGAAGSGAGTGATAGALRATRVGDGWRLDGRARWVTNGDRATVAVVLAPTPDGRALFVAEDGFTAGARAATMGLRTAAVVDVEFGAAPAVLLTTVAAELHAPAGALAPLSVAAISVGIAQAALDHAVRYAAEREQFGTAIRNFEGIQAKLAEMATRTVAARLLTERAAADTTDEAAVAMAKLAAGTCAMFVTTEAVQIFGGYGYMRDYPVEKLMRDAKAMELVHGTSEMQRLRIAASLYSD
jgi:alkylation response protein AidB-like acyl-CoA dehydrogenase